MSGGRWGLRAAEGGGGEERRGEERGEERGAAFALIPKPQQ